MSCYSQKEIKSLYSRVLRLHILLVSSLRAHNGERGNPSLCISGSPRSLLRPRDDGSENERSRDDEGKWCIHSR